MISPPSVIPWISRSSQPLVSRPLTNDLLNILLSKTYLPLFNLSHSFKLEDNSLLFNYSPLNSLKTFLFNRKSCQSVKRNRLRMTKRRKQHLNAASLILASTLAHNALIWMKASNWHAAALIQVQTKIEVPVKRL